MAKNGLDTESARSTSRSSRDCTSPEGANLQADLLNHPAEEPSFSETSPQVRKENMTAETVVNSLRQQITSCESQLQDLKRQLAEAEYQSQQQRTHLQSEHNVHSGADPLAYDFSHGVHDDFKSEILAALSQSEETARPPKRWPLESDEYKRYGRQLIMPEIGLQGRRSIL